MYLNVVQLAESFGVDEHTVDGWIREDGLPCVRDRDRLLFDRGQVVAWAAARGLAAKAGFLAPVRPSAHAGRPHFTQADGRTRSGDGGCEPQNSTDGSQRMTQLP